jgi:ABC-2 type transport system permease protein
MRYGFIGRADSVIALGLIVVPTVNALLWLLAHRMFATGYRLKP